MGTFMRDKCAARSMEGLPDGCSGNPKKTNPPTPVSGVAACAWEVMRPPKDLPPAMQTQSRRKLPGRADSRADRGVTQGWRVRSFLASLHVWELIAQGRNAVLGEVTCQPAHGWMFHSGAGTMRQDDADLGSARLIKQP